jgi:hypothetical protein
MTSALVRSYGHYHQFPWLAEARFCQESELRAASGGRSWQCELCRRRKSAGIWRLVLGGGATRADGSPRAPAAASIGLSC